MKNTKEIKLQIIDNYIDWFTSNESERGSMKEEATTYVKDDWVDEIEQSNSLLNSEKAKEIALVASVILNEDLLNGTVFQTFDNAYSIAEKFVLKYGYCEETAQIHWGVDAEFDETVIEFTENHIKKTNNNK